MIAKSTARSRELAARLRAYREQSGWEQEQLAYRLGWPVEKVIRIETGQWHLSELDVASLLPQCGMPAAERAAVMGLIDGDRDGCWVRPHGDGPPEAAPGVLFQHQTARSIFCYSPTDVPVIFQNLGYIEEDLRRRFDVDAAVGEDEAVLRDYRGILRSGFATEIVVFLHESTLRSVSVSDAMRRDLYHDLMVVIEAEQAEVRVIPADRETELRVPAFSLLRFPGSSPVVCRPCETVTLVLEDRHAATYECLVSELDEIALPSRDTLDLIREIAGNHPTPATPSVSTADELPR